MNDNLNNAKWFAIDENGCFCEMEQGPDKATIARMNKALEAIRKANLDVSNKNKWKLTLTEKEAKKPKIIKRAIAYGKLFKGGFEAEMKSSSLWSVSALTGLAQGLKYAGSLRRGLTGTLAVAIGISTINGIRTIVINHDKVTELLAESDESSK